MRSFSVKGLDIGDSGHFDVGDGYWWRRISGPDQKSVPIDRHGFGSKTRTYQILFQPWYGNAYRLSRSGYFQAYLKTGSSGPIICIKDRSKRSGHLWMKVTQICHQYPWPILIWPKSMDRARTIRALRTTKITYYLLNQYGSFEYLFVSL